MESDRLVGSSYDGLVGGVPKYTTSSYEMRNLAEYFAGFVEQNGVTYNLHNIFSEFGTFDADGYLTSLSTAFANQVLSVTTSDRFASASFVTNLGASVGVFNPDGTLNSLSEAFANQVLSVTSSERFATSLFATNLASSVGVYDETGNIISLSEAFANQVLSTTTSDKFATSLFTTNLASSFGTYNPDGSINTFSQSFADQVLSTANTADFAQASFVTNLASSFGTYNEDGSIAIFSQSFADQVLSTANTADFAQASFVTNLASSLGTTDEEGNLTISEAFANQVLQTETTTDYAQAQFVTNLAASLGTTDAEGNLTVSEAFANQVLSTETTTDYAEASFVTNLAASLGTTDAAGNLTISEAFANQVLQTETTTDYAQASFVTNLASSIGTVDAAGNLTVSEAFANSVLSTETTTDYASASSVTNLTTAVGNIPRIYRQADPPSLTETPIGSLWFDTGNSNKGYILVAGTPNVWTIVEDKEFTQFKSDYEELINTTATESSATASKTTKLNSVLEILDENGNLIPANQAEYFGTITTYVDENSAMVDKIDTLEAKVDGDGTNPGLIATLDETSSVVAAKPNVYRQDDAPTGTIPIKSVWYDTNDNNKPYVYDGSPGAWTAARDGKVVELETYVRAQKTIEANANGVITGITIKSENSGDPETAISDITFKTSTFNIVNQSDVAKLSFDGTNLSIDGSGTFTGTITATSGTFSGTVTGSTISLPTNDSNRRFYVDSQGSTYIKDQVGGTPSLLIQNEAGATRISISGNDIALQPAVASPAVTSAKVKWGAVASLYTNTDSKLVIEGATKTTGNATFDGDVAITGNLTVTGSSSSHPVISAAADVTNIGQTVIQSLDFDQFGHVLATQSLSIPYPAIVNNAGNPELPTGVTAAEIRTLIGAGTSSFSGSYTDLTNKPTLFDGDYNSLTNKPTLGTAAAAATTDFATAGHLHDSRYLRKDQSDTVSGTITATDFIITSDQRLKRDISTYEPVEMNIRFREYRLNHDPSRKRYGVIAQEVEQTHPELVITNAETGVKAVSYIDLLVAKIAELEKRIKQLENGNS